VFDRIKQILLLGIVGVAGEQAKTTPVVDSGFADAEFGRHFCCGQESGLPQSLIAAFEAIPAPDVSDQTVVETLAFVPWSGNQTVTFACFAQMIPVPFSRPAYQSNRPAAERIARDDFAVGRMVVLLGPWPGQR
jgi:hypothetical protein